MPFTVCTPAATASVCVDIKFQLNVIGVVMGELSTNTCNPSGFEVTVTSVGATPYRRMMPSTSAAEYPTRLESGIPGGIESSGGPPLREKEKAGYSITNA